MLSALFVVVVAVADPRGDFPINDDWAFAASARTLAAEGRLAFTGWQSMPLVTHAVWGAAFIAVAGDDFTWLRVSTLVLAAAGCLAGYFLVRGAGGTAASALVAGLAVLGNPWYLGLAFTFMSDVPFLALLLLSALCWQRAVAGDSGPWRGLALALAILATLSRQNGLALPLAAGLAALAAPAKRRRRELGAALVAFALTLVCLRATEALVAAGPGLPELYHAKTAVVWSALRDVLMLRGWPHFAERVLSSLMYAGLLLWPVTLLLPPRPDAPPWWPAMLTAAASGAGLLLVGTRFEMPALSNVWYGWGLGPWLDAGSAPTPPVFLGAALTIASCAGAALLLDRLSALRPGRLEAPALFLFAVGAIGSGPVVVSYAPFLDRYLLPVIAFAALAIASLAPPVPPRRTLAATAAAVLLLATSLVGVHDHLAWQRARSAVLSALLEAGVPRGDVSAGFELDNLRPELTPDTGPALLGRRPYLVASSPVAGYRSLARVPVGHWGSGPGYVHALQQGLGRVAPEGLADILPAMLARRGLETGPR